MRTDSRLQKSLGDTLSSSESKETMKVRKSLHPLQVAAGDKENLVGAGRMPAAGADKDPKAANLNSKISASPKNKTFKNQEKKPISVEDLTSEAGPSENYWQVLAETRRKALEKTLEENQQLHEKLHQMSEENKKYKHLLDEAQLIIDQLNEILVEIEEERSAPPGDNVRRP